MNAKLFTSESVSNGHPDKIADQISDAILDELLTEDKKSRVAVETLVKTGMVLVAGEVKTNAWVDIEKIARNTINEIGYIHSDMGFDGASCAVINAIGKQSDDIAKGVDKNDDDLNQGAGDQGLMFGYATDETDVFMPAPIYYAHKLMRAHADYRNTDKDSYLRPDAKSQVTFAYENNQAKHIDTIVLSSQHHPSISNDSLEDLIHEEIIKKAIPKNLLTKKTKYFINPTGRFVVGGPMGDCGLTGRKIIVDTYGGMARHGGGAFSGKDPSKVDRSAAYAMRHLAKNIVSAGLAKKCEIQISYAIGVAKPVSIDINTFGTSNISDERLSQIISSNFDFSPFAITKNLNLLEPIYKKTASYGHFGRDIFPWEELNLVEKLKSLF